MSYIVNCDALLAESCAKPVKGCGSLHILCWKWLLLSIWLLSIASHAVVSSGASLIRIFRDNKWCPLWDRI